MLSSSLRTVRLACGVCLVIVLALPTVWGQEATPAPSQPATPESAATPAPDATAPTPPEEAAAPAAAAAEPSPSDAQPAAKPASPAPKQPAAAVPVVLPAFDYARLAHPSVADQLELTDEQRATVAQLINQRATQLAAAPQSERKAILEAADQKLAAVLNETQSGQLATLATEQKLRFNFREQKWADVLDWFARQADLALVMDKSPPGAFTYTNNRSYSPTEAIDLLNSVLLTKGFSLLQRGRMLILVDLTDDLPSNLIPRVEAEGISQRGDFEIISVLFPLAGRPADAVVKEIQPLIGKYGDCVGLPQTGQLLVTETAGKMRAISILIASIPTPKPPPQPEKPKEKPAPPPPVLAVYPVTVIDPAAAVETLGILFGNAKFTVDDKAEQVMAYARPDEQAAIKAAVDQMEANRPAEKQPRLEVYPIDLPDAEQLVEQLETALPDVQASMDTTLGRLLVFASPQDQDTVKEMIQKLGATDDVGAKQVVVYRPKHFDPTALTTLIKQIAPRAEVSTDAALRRVVVSTGPAQQTMIKSLVDQLDQESALEDKPLLQIYSLDKSIDASLVATLTAMLPDATVTRSTDGRQLSVVARVVDQTIVKKMVDQWTEVADSQEEPALKIYPLERPLAASDLATITALVPGATATLSTDSRQLSVIARTADQDAVQSLIKRLTEAASAQPKPDLQVYPLTQVLTAADVANLTALVPGAQITLAPDGRQLRVVALADEQQEVAERIKQFEAAAAAEVKPELAVIPLSKPLNPTVMATLQTLVPQAKLTVSLDGKELIVVARVDEQAIIKKTLDQIAVSAGAVEQQLEIYQFDGLSAVELQSLLQTLAVHSTLTVDVPQDRLIVWGPAEEHKAFGEVIAKLEQNPLSGTKPVLQFYPLDDLSQFTNISSVLTSLVPTAKLTWDEEAKRAMVIATPKDQQSIRQTIEQIVKNAGPVEEQVLRLYALSPAQQTRFEAVQTDLLQGLPGMRVIKDPQTGELAIWGKASQHQKLSDVLEQLKVKGDSAGTRLLIGYAINSGSATTVFEMLQQLFPNVKLSLDEKSERILAYASLSEHGRIKQTIAQMDVEGEPSNKEELRAYATGDANPTSLVTVLQQLVPDMQLTPDLAAKKLIAWGTVRDHEALEKAIEQLRNGDADQRPVIRAYPMEGREVRSLIYMRGVLLEVVPDAAITIDPRGGSIVASATLEDHKKLKEAIDEIVRLNSDENLSLETYSLDKLTATQVIPTLQPVVPSAQISPGMDPRQIVVWASPEDHQRVVAALAKLEEASGGDSERVLQLHRVRPAVAAQAGVFIARNLPNLQVLTGQGSDRLLVWGTPKDHERLAALIQQMDSELGLDTDRTMKTYELDDVSSVEARRVLDSAFGNLEYVADSRTDRLVIWADADTHIEVAKLVDELKKVVAIPEQVLKVHRFEPDEMDVTTVYNALAPEDIKELTIQVNTVTNSLIVRGPADRQVALSEILANLVDQLPTAEKPEAVVYRLNRADPTAAALLVRSLLPAVPVAVDIANQTLAATATPKDHAKIREVLDQLDNKEGGDLVTETYVMKRGNPTAVMTAIKPIVPRATMSADIYNKMLIVTATAEEHTQIKTIIERADGEGNGELTITAYPLKYANPYTISAALTSVVPAATVSPDALNKMLIVTATAEDHQRIQAVLEQADKRGGGDLETKAYVLQLANPSTIAVALTSVVPNATVSPDVVNKMLIVTATKEDHVRVASIVDEADRRSEGEMTTEVYSLKFANPLALSYSIKPIAPNATASPDIYNKTLIVTATAKDHERIKTVIDQADKSGGGDQTTKAYSLKWANPITINTALTTVVPDAKISSDAVNKMLIVTASKEDHAKIQEVLDQADKRGGGELVTRAYTLQTANPSTIMLALRPVVPDATVSSDITNKMLIVTASEEDHVKIAAVVDEADHRSDGELLTEVYTLKWANPTALSYSLAPIAPNAVISPDIYNKSLFVTATAKDHARIKALVEQADQRGGGELTTEAYSLKWANPITITTALTAVVPDAKISADTLNKMLIVTANKEDHTKIKSVIDQADLRGGGDLATKAYVLQLANPSTIAVALANVVPNATVSPDVVNKMLVVTASEEDHARVKTIVDEADRRSEGEMTTEVYALKFANPLALSYSIKPIAPNATASPDVYNKTLVVTATAKDHLNIKKVIDQADKRGGGDLLTKAYPLRWANPTTISVALTAVVPDATLSTDVVNKMLVVTANKEDHATIQEVLDQADKRGGGDLVTKAYPLRTANPSTIMLAVRPVVPDATLSADPTNRMLVVTASEEDHLRVKTIVDAADRRGDGELTTKVYPFKLANPATVATALRVLIPDAQLSTDVSTNTLIVTGTAEDHQQVEPLVKELDVASPTTRVVKPYTVENADPQEVYQSLTQLFRYNQNISVGYQEETGMILVFAPMNDQDEVGQAISEIDKATAGRPQATLEVYRLEGLDGDAAIDTLTALLKDETPKIDLQIDDTNNQILAIAEPEQQAMIRKALAQLEPTKREVEVFTLERVDPYTAELAIDAMFTDLPFAAMPSIEADPDMQQLIVHATKEQLVRIGELLEKMGEGSVKATGRQSNSMLRVIKLSGDTEAMLREIEKIWPQVRGNQMQIVTPPKQGRQPSLRPLTPPANDAEPADNNQPEADAPQPGVKPVDEPVKAAAARRAQAMFVSTQLPTPQPGAESEQRSTATQNGAVKPSVTDPGQIEEKQIVPGRVDANPVETISTESNQAVPNQAVPNQAVPNQAVPSAQELLAQGDASLPPIVIIAGEGRLTVASRDIEAINQFEELLQTLQRGRRVSFANGNFSMFLLQNADAKELAEVLTSLFRRDASSSRGGYRSSSRRRSTNLMVVADERMNALLVYGSSADRAVVEEMLDVLDSVDIPDSLSTERPRMIPIKNLPAGTVLSVLTSVYKSQLQARRGLRPVTIPVGISPEMTSMMELLNATANSPILTLDVDETTNSIVMRAPRQLGEEIEEFVQELDVQAEGGGTRNISLVPLKGMNSDQIENALQLLMRGGRYRRSGGGYRGQ